MILPCSLGGFGATKALVYPLWDWFREATHESSSRDYALRRRIRVRSVTRTVPESRRWDRALWRQPSRRRRGKGRNGKDEEHRVRSEPI